MKKFNLILCTTILLSSCAISIAMEDANKIMFDSTRTGLEATKPIKTTPTLGTSTIGSNFFRKCGISEKDILNMLKIPENLQPKYIAYLKGGVYAGQELKGKMSKLNSSDQNYNKATAVNILVRKFIKTWDLYQDVAARGKKAAIYKNYKNYILNEVVPKLKIDGKRIVFPGFSHHSPWKGQVTRGLGKAEKSPSEERRALRAASKKLAYDDSDETNSEDEDSQELAYDSDEIDSDDDNGDEVATDNSDEQESDDQDEDSDQVAYDSDEIDSDDDNGDEVATDNSDEQESDDETEMELSQGPAKPKVLDCGCCAKTILSDEDDDDQSPENSMIAQDTEDDAEQDEEESEIN